MRARDGARTTALRRAWADARRDVDHARWLASRHRETNRSVPTLRDGLARFVERWPGVVDDGPDDEPVLLFAAGWRSGSTMVQRLLMSDGRTVVWGEPYNQLDLVRRMAEMFTGFTPGYPAKDIRWPAHVAAGDPTGDWVANLYPDGPDLLAAHRRFHLELFGVPAERVGATNWGIKAVRLDAGHARYFRLLFPRARIVFLVRDPFRSYASYRRQGNRWYDRWPDRPAFTPQAFGRVWQRTAASFVEDQHELGALVVRYEDLVNGSRVAELGDHCGVEIDPAVLARRVTLRDHRRRFGGDPSAPEMAVLDRVVRSTAEVLGYRRSR